MEFEMGLGWMASPPDGVLPDNDVGEGAKDVGEVGLVSGSNA